ncbi:MAG TPA: DUF4189 domain-containing protein [Alphaproteobacteria bacterium]|nr:DUF4189 domain-containing protein [Alphaproteobacteria bacterium]
MGKSGVSVLIVSFALAVLMAPAQAKNVNGCIDSCFNGVGDAPGHTALRDLCVKRCSEHADSYGAIAYDAESGAVGWSYDFDDSTAAEQFALKNCAEHGDGCKVVVHFWNSCGAVAADDDHFATGLGRNRADAETKALAACGGAGGGKCEIQAWSCALP